MPEARFTNVAYSGVGAGLAAVHITSLVNDASPSRTLWVQNVAFQALVANGRLLHAFLAISQVTLGRLTKTCGFIKLVICEALIAYVGAVCVALETVGIGAQLALAVTGLGAFEEASRAFVAFEGPL